MTIFALMIAVQNPDNKQVYIVHRDYEVSSVNFFARNEAKNSFKFVVRQSLPCIDKHTRNTVKHQDKLCYIQMSGKPVAAYAFTDQSYPQRVVFALLRKSLDIFFDKVGQKWKNYTEDQNLNIDDITTEFKKYQDPTKADKLMLAQKKVDETKVILHQNIKILLERQGDLDELVAKSKDLSDGAKQFYKSSKKMDRCCYCSII